MSINLTDEIEVKTKKGKLGAAKQIFLEGDTQTVEKEIQEINSRQNDLSSTVSGHAKQIESNQSKITANKSAQDEKNASLDSNMAKLNTRDDQITELVKAVTATGGASQASAVTYENTESGLDSVTIQGAIDELENKKFDKESILQELGKAEDKVISQKVVSSKLSDLDLQINGNDGNITIELSPISGKYYTGIVDSIITIVDHQDFSYCEPIDVSDYIGKQILIKRSGEDTSGAICAFGDNNNINIKRINHNVDFVLQPDGSYLYDGVIPENSKTLYLSSRTSILISVNIKANAHKGLRDTISDNTSRIEVLEENNREQLGVLEGKITELTEEINGKTNEKYIALSPINGKYYTGIVGSKITIGEHQDFSYCAPINVAEDVGKQITIERSGDDTSGALCAFGDDNDINIKRIVHSMDFVQKGDIYVYEGVVPENAKTLYLSSRTSVLLSVRIVGERIEGLSDKVDSNTERIIALENNSDSQVSIQPQRFSVLPYKVYKKNGVYSVEDIYAKKVVDAKIYVHSINGLDTNNGTESAPLKTLKAALTKFNTLGKSAEVVIMDAATYYVDELYGELGYQYSLIINAHKGATLINGMKTTYTKKNGYENVYECANTGKTLIGCVYVSNDNIDSFGLYKALNPVSSIALVDSTINSYYIESGVVYVHLADNSKVNDVIPIVNGYGVRFTCFNRRDCFLYLRGLNIIGGNYNNARSSNNDDGHTLEYIIEDCKFQNSMVGDMIPSNNFNVMYFINVIGGYSKQDVFNHHANYMTESQIDNSVVVCVNCLSEYAGWYGLHGVSGEPFNNNLYTSHEGMNVLRVNCKGQHSEGPMFADVNGCRSVNIDCEALNTFFTAQNVNINGCFTFNSTDSRKADITINRCNGFDVRTPSLANCDAKLEGTNIDWSRVVANDISIVE